VTRTLLTGGRVFDGTGAAPGEADVLVEDGRILQVGPGLDGDEAVDVGGRYLLAGLFDCHTHLTLTIIPGRWSSSGRRTRACPTAWSTGPRPCGARSAS
jgi:predicted amidohydrolase YtcJ